MFIISPTRRWSGYCLESAEALRRFRRAGFARVLVTNQSAIGRGMLTTERLDQIHAEMNRQLATHGTTSMRFITAPMPRPVTIGPW